MPPTISRNILVVDTTVAGMASAADGVVGKAAQFSAPTIEALRAQGHHVQITTFVPPTNALRAADIVWSEWCNEAAYQIAASGAARRFIIRVRGFDIWTPLHQMQWANVYAIVHESPYIQKVFNETLAYLGGTLPPTVQQHVIPAGIDLEKFTFQEPVLPKAESPVIAVVARAIPSKGQQLIYEWARRMPNVQIHMTTALGEYDDRFMRYLEAAKPPNVHLCGTVSPATWLREIGAQILLSASMYESLSYVIVEAMAMGLIPLVHTTPDNAINWPQLTTWATLDQLTRQFESVLWGDHAAIVRESYEHRAHVERNYDGKTQAALFAQVLFKDFVSTAPSVEFVPIQGNEIEAIEAVLANDGLMQAVHILRSWQPSPAEFASYAQVTLRTAQMAHVEGEHGLAARLAVRVLEVAPDAQAFTLLGKIAEAQADTPRALHWFHLATTFAAL